MNNLSYCQLVHITEQVGNKQKRDQLDTLNGGKINNCKLEIYKNPPCCRETTAW